MAFKLWWTAGYACTTEKEFLAAKHRLSPATFETVDEALQRANQIGHAGGYAWLIEGDDKTRISRDTILKTITKRGSELDFERAKPMTASDHRRR
jgi:hypothetical protein